MADQSPSNEERTIEATPYRKEKARKEGKVAHSKDLSAVIILLSGTLLLLFIGKYWVENLYIFFHTCICESPNHFIDTTTFLHDAPDIITRLLGIVLPFFGILFLIAIGVNILQVGFKITLMPLKPQLKRISPSNGFKRLFSLYNFFEMVKTITKVTIISMVAYFSIKKSIPLFLKQTTGQLQYSLIVLAKISYNLIFHCITTLLIIAIIDYFYQRYHYKKSLRMTPQELKQEQKELMGNPEIRSKIRQVQLHLSRQRMMKAVPTSDFILVNPTHYAIALKYSPELMHAPRVVAKGQLKIAQRIIALATKHNIPIIHRPEIARALFPVAIIGQEIPVEFYEIIAEILAEIYKKRGQHHTVLPSKQNGI